MQHTLEQKLFKKFPKIFKNYENNKTNNLVSWQLTCGDGWYKIIYNLCKKIQKHVDKAKIDQVEAMQVKEKFGGLRFYVNHGSDNVYNYIYEAEKESFMTCERCGSTHNVKQHRSHWIVTLCEKCKERKDEK